MWIYVSSTGRLYHYGAYADCGYSGKGQYTNKLECEWRSDLGPIPQGEYKIGPIVNHQVTRTDGTTFTLFSALKLDPVGHDCCGRFGFWIHGGNMSGGSSEGCIILPIETRKKIDSSGDNVLLVIAYEADTPFRVSPIEIKTVLLPSTPMQATIPNSITTLPPMQPHRQRRHHGIFGIFHRRRAKSF